jgi:crotonobetainyl-CoA:carnitine CoA-transferase CaiB-like acyl-CoA transferase
LRSVPPKFGEHATAVLTEFGYSKDEVDALMARGVVCGTDRKR